MTVSAIATRLKTIQEGIAGVKKAHDLTKTAGPPNRLPSDYLPTVINVPGEASYNVTPADLKYETRLWFMLLYVAPIQAPHEIAQRLAEAAPFLDSFEAEFLALPTLGGLDGVTEAIYLGDGGITFLNYAGVDYTGIEFRVRITEIINVVPKDCI